MYLLEDMFPNNELKMSDRDLSQEKYEQAVDKIFSFYPKPVSKIFLFVAFFLILVLYLDEKSYCS